MSFNIQFLKTIIKFSLRAKFKILTSHAWSGLKWLTLTKTFIT